MSDSLRIDLLGKKTVESSALKLIKVHRLVTHGLPAAYVDIRISFVRFLNHLCYERVLVHLVSPLDGVYLLVKRAVDDLCSSARLYVLRVHIRGKR